MFLARDSSNENISHPSMATTLRTYTSEKRLSVLPTHDEDIVVGCYKYNQKKLLGKGFSSKVYKATNTITNQQNYAIKVINLRKFKAANIAMLESEIDVHRSLTHPNIVQFYEAYRTQQFYYIVTEYCPDGDLMSYLNQRKKIDENRALNIVQQIIQGYTYMAKKFVLHRDLKPANVFRSGDTWKIGDFGFAMYCKAQAHFDKINVGTPLYMPLESLRSNKYSPKTDIFAIGIIFYEMITGRTPWESKSQKQLLSKLNNKDPIKYPELKNIQIRKFIGKACEIMEFQRLSLKDLPQFFGGLAVTNPQEKQNQSKTFRNVLSLKVLKQTTAKLPFKQHQKNTSLAAICSTKDLSLLQTATTICSSTSTKAQNSEKMFVKVQNYKQKNNKLLLQELQFCRLIYYIVKNFKFYVISSTKVHSFAILVLFKFLLKCIKQLEETQKRFSTQLQNFQIYKFEKQYLRMETEIKSYAKRYQKQYLDILKNTQISTIRQVSKAFPELSYNSSLNDRFYANYYDYFISLLMVTNHQVSNLNKQFDQYMEAGHYQAVDTLFSFCEAIKYKMQHYKQKKQSALMGFCPKVIMDYRHSKLNKQNYKQLRNKIKLI